MYYNFVTLFTHVIAACNKIFNVNNFFKYYFIFGHYTDYPWNR